MEQKIIQKYIEAALIQERATLEGNHRKANKAIKVRISCLTTLQDQLHFLEPLLQHENANVRVWAAFDMLERGHCISQCISVLKELAKGKDIIALGAEMTLKRHNIKPDGEVFSLN